MGSLSKQRLEAREVARVRSSFKGRRAPCEFLHHSEGASRCPHAERLLE